MRTRLNSLTFGFVPARGGSGVASKRPASRKCDKHDFCKSVGNIRLGTPLRLDEIEMYDSLHPTQHWLFVPPPKIVVVDADCPESTRWCQQRLRHIPHVRANTTRGAHFYIRLDKSAPFGSLCSPKDRRDLKIDIRYRRNGFVRLTEHSPSVIATLLNELESVPLTALPEELRLERGSGIKQSTVVSEEKRVELMKEAFDVANRKHGVSGSEKFASAIWSACSFSEDHEEIVNAVIANLEHPVVKQRLKKHTLTNIKRDVKRLERKARIAKVSSMTGGGQFAPDEEFKDVKLSPIARRVLVMISRHIKEKNIGWADGDGRVFVGIGLQTIANMDGKTKSWASLGVKELINAGIMRVETQHIFDAKEKRRSRVRVYEFLRNK